MWVSTLINKQPCLVLKYYTNIIRVHRHKRAHALIENETQLGPSVSSVVIPRHRTLGSPRNDRVRSTWRLRCRTIFQTAAAAATNVDGRGIERLRQRLRRTSATGRPVRVNARPVRGHHRSGHGPRPPGVRVHRHHRVGSVPGRLACPVTRAQNAVVQPVPVQRTTVRSQICRSECHHRSRRTIRPASYDDERPAVADASNARRPTMGHRYSP